MKWKVHKSKLKTDDFRNATCTKNVHREIKVYVWSCVEQKCNLSTECLVWLSGLFYFWCLSSYLVLKVLGRYDCKVWLYVSCTEYQQCVGTMETARRGPTGHRGLLCDISVRCDVISHGVMELRTHEVLMKTGNNIHFPRLQERLNEDSVVTRAWCGHIKMQPGQTLGLSSPQILKLETSQLTRFCSLVMSHSSYETGSEVMRL